MASTYNLAVQVRTVFGKKADKLRDQDLIPGVVYGQNSENISISVPAREFKKVFQAAGESSLIDLKIGDKDSTVLVHDIQRDPITGEFIHVDFYRVSMTKKLTAVTPLVFTGESKAVKELGAILLKSLDHVTIECLPKDLVHEIVIDLNQLENIDDSVRLSGIVVPDGVTIIGESGTVVVSVQPPRKLEDIAADEATTPTADVSAVEVEKKGKKEEGETVVAPSVEKK